VKMVEFFSSLTLFILAHTLPEPTGLRTGLINRYGKKTYIIGFSVLSILLLTWLIWSALRAPYISLWLPTPTTALIPVILMLPVCILVSTAILHPNPLSLAFVQRPTPEKPDITTIVRHPLLWALFFWAASHTIANGDLVGVIMFGGFAVFSLMGMKLFERRANRHMTKQEFKLAMSKKDGRLITRLQKLARWPLFFELGAGMVLYLSLLHLHDPIIGVDPLAVLFP